MKASTRWRVITSWYRRNASLSLTLAIGLAIGIGCRYPTNWALPDNTAAMFAAVIGALATAAAVVIGINVQTANEVSKEAERQAHLRMRVKIMLQPMLGDLAASYKQMVKIEYRARTLANLARDVDAALDRLRMSAVINDGLNNDGLVGLSYVEMRAATVVVTIQTLEIVADLVGRKKATEVEFEKARKNFATQSNSLIDEVFELAGGDSLEEWKLTISHDSDQSGIVKRDQVD